MTRKAKREYAEPSYNVFDMVFRFLGWMLTGMGKGIAWTARAAFAGTVWAARMSGKAIAWMWRYAWAAITWPFQFVWGIMGDLVGRAELTGDPRQDAIIKRIRRKFRRRNRFITHIFFFVMGNAALWIDWYASGYYISNRAMSGYFGFTFAWSLILFFHFVRWRMTEAEDKAVQEALAEERAWQMNQQSQPPQRRTNQEKPKRHVIYEDELEVGVEVPEDEIYTGQRLHLSDDGELAEEFYNTNETGSYDYQ